MNEEQEEINQSESFTKQQMEKGKNKLKEEGKKQAKQKIVKFLAANPEVVAILAIVIAVAILVVVFICGALYVVDKWKETEVNDAKQKTMEISYTGNTSTIETDDDGNIINKIVVQPNSNKSGYEIAYNDDSDNLENIKNMLEAETSISASRFSDFELAVLGALIDNGADLDYYTEEQLHCFPAFIRAEAATQFLDLRKNDEKFKNGIYTPMQLSDFSGKNNNQVSGVVLVQRTNTNGNAPSTLEYMQEADFNKLVENNDEKARNYFTINNKGNLIIAKWDMKEITVKGKYPDNLLDVEKEQTTGKVYIITTEEIAYSEYIKKYTMPFEFLVQLLVITQEPDFCMELADYVMGSKIVINIQEEETYTHTIEERTYTVHSKDEKRIDYKVGSVVEIEANQNYLLGDKKDDKGQACTNYEVNDKKVTIDRKYTSHSYSFEITEADTWLAHYTKNYAILSGEQEPEHKDTVTDIPDDYSEIPSSKSITDSNEIIKDKDVKKFKNEKEEYYKNLITVPEVKLKLGTKYIWDPLAEKYTEIYGDDEISVTPISKIVSTSLPSGSTSYKCEHSKLPSQINVTTIEENEVPSIRFTYNLNNGKYETAYTKGQISECNVTKLDMKKFERIDLVNNITENVTKYKSDPSPVKKTHIYATESGTPGKGHGDESVKYEKFLVAYDNNRNARDQINSIDYWLYEMMEEKDSTLDFIDTVKYLFYMYDGKNRGITELSVEGLLETNMSSFGNFIYGDSLEEKVWFTLRAEGYSEEAVAAIMGNIYGESGFRADAIESNGEGYGLCQWSFGRKKQLIEYAKSKGKDWKDEDTQIEFLIGEITKGGGANGYAKFQMGETHYGYTYSSWKDATDIEVATKAFMAVFERPNMNVAHTDRRVKAAKDYYNQFHGKERAGGQFNAGKGDIIGTYTSTITGRTFTIFNQTKTGLASSMGSEWNGYCNLCVAACIVTGYNGGNANDALTKALNYNYILSNDNNTNNYFNQYGLTGKVSYNNAYSTKNIRENLLKGNYIAIRFKGATYGKSGQQYTAKAHWIGIIGYKEENGKEQIFISDSGHGATGWKDLDEFDRCKGTIQYFTIISEK